MAEEHYSPERLAQFAKRARDNHNAVLAFTGLMAGVALIFIFFHLIRLISSRTTSTSQKSKKPSPLVKLGRHIRSITLRKAPALPSVGHAGVVGIYFAINVALTFGFIDYNNMTPLSNIGSRAGWMAIANMVLLVFLALKNTPLAFLSSYSYERLNSLHQYAGYSTILFTIIHVSLYCTYFVQAGRPTRLLYTNEIFGMVAALSFLALGITGGIVRRFNYELFYVLHVSFWVLAVVMVGLHQPELSKKIIFGTCVAGGMWGLDRLIRFVRLMAYSTNNTVIVTPLSHGATRVTLKKPPVGAVAGKHCFLWIPRIRTIETHPFTMSSTEPTEFVINSYDGFTSDLHQYAAKHPGAELKASVEGPYGTFPSPASRDKLVLVAGGSGATFTFGTALHMLKSMSPDDNKSITFVWVVRDRSYLSWFTQSLKTLNSDRRVSILIYVTRSSTVEQLTPPSSSAGRGDDEETKLSELGIEPRQTLERAPDSSTSIDFEKTAPSPSSTSDDSDAPASVRETALELALPIIDGRPDVGSLVRTEIEAMPSHGSVLVMGCGPAGLMTDLRNTTAGCIRAEGPTVELHCEQFGW